LEKGGWINIQLEVGEEKEGEGKRGREEEKREGERRRRGREREENGYREDCRKRKRRDK
jgi:hypothetical protein